MHGDLKHFWTCMTSFNTDVQLIVSGHLVCLPFQQCAENMPSLKSWTCQIEIFFFFFQKKAQTTNKRFSKAYYSLWEWLPVSCAWHKRLSEGCENEFPKVKSVLKMDMFWVSWCCKDKQQMCWNSWQKLIFSMPLTSGKQDYSNALVHMGTSITFVIKGELFNQSHHLIHFIPPNKVHNRD